MTILPLIRSLLRHPVGSMIIVAQVAITLAIISNSAFIINERLKKVAQPSGIVESEILLANISYVNSLPDRDAINAEDLKTLKAFPGVISVAHTNSIPFSSSNRSSTFCYQDFSNMSDENCPESASIFMGGYELLDTLGLKLTEGRNFLPEEIVKGNGFDLLSDKIILSKAFADHYFPNTTAVGKTLFMSSRPHEIVGVVERLLRPGKNHEGQEAMYSALLPLRHTGNIVLRVEPSLVNQLGPDIEGILRNISDRRAIKISTMDELRGTRNRDDHAMLVILLTVIALLAVITGLGISGLVNFAVENRRKQIGTRRALGARKIDILTYFHTETGILAFAGIAIGVLLAFGLNQYLIRQYELTQISLSFVALSVVFLAIVTQLATFFPARRAIRISPAIATRSV